MTALRTSDTISMPKARSSLAGGFVSRAWPILVAVVILALALPTGLVAVLEGAGHLPLPFNLHVIDQALPIAFRLHMVSSGAVLLLIPIVFAVRRDRHWHRPLGWLAAFLVVTGALTSFPVAFWSSSPDWARAGFAAQGAAWLWLVTAAVSAARHRAVSRHARLMMAMTAVATGAIWTRLTTAVIATYDLPFEPIYAAVAWLGWMLPMAAVLRSNVIPLSLSPRTQRVEPEAPPRLALTRSGE